MSRFKRAQLFRVLGQIKEVGAHFYNTVVEVDILKEESIFNTQHIIMRLKFQNSAFKSTVGALVG